MWTLFFLVPAIFIILWVISIYNFFVSSKARIKASVQEIGNQLKRQFDLIPNLEESVKGYLKHEKSIFEDLTDARKSINDAVKSGDVQKMVDAGDKLTSILPNIKVAVESNPEIKGSEVVQKLMDELRDTSDKVMYARRLLIDLTADFNIKVETFPSNMVAKLFNIIQLPGLITEDAGEHLAVSKDETKAPKVKLV